MSENCNLTITKGADKGEKIVAVDTAGHTEHCELLLNSREFYEKKDTNPTLCYIEEIKQIPGDMLKNNYITKQKYGYLAENLENPRSLLSYGLIKIHKKLIHSHHYDLPSIALISPHGICKNLSTLS